MTREQKRKLWLRVTGTTLMAAGAGLAVTVAVLVPAAPKATGEKAELPLWAFVGLSFALPGAMMVVGSFLDRWADTFRAYRGLPKK